MLILGQEMKETMEPAVYGDTMGCAWWRYYWYSTGIFLWFVSQAWVGSNLGRWQGVRVVALITRFD